MVRKKKRWRGRMEVGRMSECVRVRERKREKWKDMPGKAGENTYIKHVRYANNVSREKPREGHYCLCQSPPQPPISTKVPMP